MRRRARIPGLTIAAVLAGTAWAATSAPAPRAAEAHAPRAVEARAADAAGASAAVGASSVTLVAGDVPYGPGRSQRLDVHVAPGAERPPAVLVVHGGGWSRGDRHRMTTVSESLASAGFAAFNVDYSLARPWRPGYGRQLAELRAAVRWIRRHAPRFGADGARVGAVGSSAGGHLVALLATLGRAPRARRPLDAAVTWSAPLDLAALARQALAPAVADFLGCGVRLCPGRASAASPSRWVDRGDAPMLLANSTDEVTPLRQTTAMAALLEQAGVSHSLWILPGDLHAREYASLVMPDTVAFLRGALR